jgi:hypothetical protein
MVFLRLSPRGLDAPTGRRMPDEAPADPLIFCGRLQKVTHASLDQQAGSALIGCASKVSQLQASLSSSVP